MNVAPIHFSYPVKKSDDGVARLSRPTISADDARKVHLQEGGGRGMSGTNRHSVRVSEPLARERIISGELLEKDSASTAADVRGSTYDHTRDSHPGFFKRNAPSTVGIPAVEARPQHVPTTPYASHALNLYVDTAVLDQWLNRSTQFQVDYFI